MEKRNSNQANHLHENTYCLVNHEPVQSFFALELLSQSKLCLLVRFENLISLTGIAVGGLIKHGLIELLKIQFSLVK